MKKTLIALVAVAACTAAQAQVSANLALTSNYKFRGIDQTNNDPAIQGGFDYELDGFYIGNWNSSVGFTDAGIEMDFYGGYKGETGSISYDIGALHYAYPSLSDAKTTELYGAIGFGPLSLKYSHTVSKKWFGTDEGRGNGYLDLSADFDLGSGFTVNTHVGYNRFTSDWKDVNGLPNYVDYLLGVSYDFGDGFGISGAAVGGTKKTEWGDGNKTRFILTLSKSM